jgi:hypothetical protein
MTMTAAVISASASIIVAVLVFVLTQWGQLRLERRRARLARLDAQLRELYGPLNTLTESNEFVWRELRQTWLPDSAQRRSGMPLTSEEEARWTAWIKQALMPANRRMRDIILNNAHLVIESEMPEPLQAFCAHVAAFEIILAQGRQSSGLTSQALAAHPGERYVTYVRNAYVDLKEQQARILRFA